MRLLQLKEQFLGFEYRHRRGRKILVFGESIEMIRRFCECDECDDGDNSDNGDEGRERKGMVMCGLLWIDADTIAVNIQRLRWLMSKSKSTLNDDFTELLYQNVKPSEVDQSMLRRAVGEAELNRWSFRRREVSKFEFEYSDNDGLRWCVCESDSDNQMIRSFISSAGHRDIIFRCRQQIQWSQRMMSTIDILRI
jgi:hypothetical protein